jgi:hypothetical protein
MSINISIQSHILDYDDHFMAPTKSLQNNKHLVCYHGKNIQERKPCFWILE